MSCTFAVAEAFRCPVCHSGVDLVDEQTAPRCSACGFSARIADGVVDFVPEDAGGGERAFYDDFYERTRVGQMPGALVDLARTWTEAAAPWETQRVWDRLGDLRNQTVLLLCNGESYNELYLLMQQPRAPIYSDLSPVGLRELRRHIDAARHGNLLFAAIDAIDLPLRDASVDVVYGFAFAHHLPDVERFLGEVARVLRPGGRCVLMDNAYSPIWQHLEIVSFAPHAAESSKGAALTRGRPRDDGGWIPGGATGGAHPRRRRNPMVRTRRAALLRLASGLGRALPRGSATRAPS